MDYGGDHPVQIPGLTNKSRKVRGKVLGHPFYLRQEAVKPLCVQRVSDMESMEIFR
jgi:hypothetical protein